MWRLLLFLLLLGWLLSPADAFVSRQELFANSDAGVRIHIRDVRTDAHRACARSGSRGCAYVREALASDPETNKHAPPCFRAVHSKIASI